MQETSSTVGILGVYGMLPEAESSSSFNTVPGLPPVNSDVSKIN